MIRSKVLLTGGSGFIGSHLVSFLEATGMYDILNVDIQPPDSQSQLHVWKDVNLLNITELRDVIHSFRPNFVFHLAARTDLGGTELDEYAVNTCGTANLIGALEEVDSIKKVIFCSSMLVCKAGYIPKDDVDVSPPNVYGQSKVEMERIIRSRSHKYDWVIIRPTSIWGPGFKEPYRNFFQTIINGQFLDIGTRYSTKTYGYVGNSVYQIYQLLCHPGTHRKTYYIGDAPPIYISAWAKEIADSLGVGYPKKIPYVVIKLAAIVGDWLKVIGINFPMTSFRLNNMTTDNIFDLSDLYKIAPNPPFTRLQGIQETAYWLQTQQRQR